MRPRKPSLAAIRRANAMFAPIGGPKAPAVDRLSQNERKARIGTPPAIEPQLDLHPETKKA